jgi:hypothetical protein
VRIRFVATERVRMQLKTNIFVPNPTRYFHKYFSAQRALSLALRRKAWHITSVLGLRGTGGPSRACVSTVPPAPDPSETGGDAKDPSEKVGGEVAYSATFLQLALQTKELVTDKSVRIRNFYTIGAADGDRLTAGLHQQHYLTVGLYLGPGGQPKPRQSLKHHLRHHGDHGSAGSWGAFRLCTTHGPESKRAIWDQTIRK